MAFVLAMKFMMNCTVTVTAEYLDVEDVVNAIGNDFYVQSANQMVEFTTASENSDLVDQIIGEVHSSTVDHYGVINRPLQICRVSS